MPNTWTDRFIKIVDWTAVVIANYWSCSIEQIGGSLALIAKITVLTQKTDTWAGIANAHSRIYYTIKSQLNSTAYWTSVIPQ